MDLFTVPPRTVIDHDPVSGKLRFTEPSGCRYLLRRVKTYTGPTSVTFTAGVVPARGED